MQPDHQLRGAFRFNLPLTDDRRWNPRDEERPWQTNHAFTGADPSPRGLATREHREIAIQIKGQDLAGLKSAVFRRALVRRRSKKQMRAHRIPVVENAVG